MVTVDFSALPRHDLDSVTLGEYLELLLDVMSERGFSAFFITLYQSVSGITCVHCVIPGLERFHLVRRGLRVLPGSRGLRILDQGLGVGTVPVASST